MFAFVFRGVFLIGIISWYSTSVWKMIDVYFKDRFQSYLRAEYDKNPHMLADIKAYRAAAGKESAVRVASIAKPDEHSDEIVKVCTTDVCPVSKAEDSTTRDATIDDNKEITSFNEPDVTAEPEIIETTTSAPVILENVIAKVDNGPAKVPSEMLKNHSTEKLHIDKKKLKRRVVAVEDKIEEAPKSAKKNKFKTITLTEKDFASTRIKVTPQDFAEFDVDEDTVQSNEDESDTVLISELPFKPKADIGNLRKVSPQEFCPLTLDEEFSCDETKTWP